MCVLAALAALACVAAVPPTTRAALAPHCHGARAPTVTALLCSRANSSSAAWCTMPSPLALPAGPRALRAPSSVVVLPEPGCSSQRVRGGGWFGGAQQFHA